MYDIRHRIFINAIFQVEEIPFVSSLPRVLKLSMGIEVCQILLLHVLR